jgi:hypothetical protein
MSDQENSAATVSLAADSNAGDDAPVEAVCPPCTKNVEYWMMLTAQPSPKRRRMAATCTPGDVLQRLIKIIEQEKKSSLPSMWNWNAAMPKPA